MLIFIHFEFFKAKVFEFKIYDIENQKTGQFLSTKIKTLETYVVPLFSISVLFFNHELLLQLKEEPNAILIFFMLELSLASTFCW